MKKITQKGFTLIELLIVVMILGILTSLAAPRLSGRTDLARLQAVRADLSGGLGLALDLYEVDCGTYPSRLEDLLTRPQGFEEWKGPYLKRGLPRDPWGNAYIYRYPGVENKDSYDLFSVGKDKTEGTGDDVRS